MDDHDQAHAAVARTSRRAPATYTPPTVPARRALYFMLAEDGRTPEPVPLDDAVAMQRWAAFYERGSRTVAVTAIGPVRVCTEFLAMDTGYMDAAPLLFATRTVRHDGGLLPTSWLRLRLSDRFGTWDEATAGHASIVARVRAVLDAEERDGTV